jgi:hypothetical protein
LCLRGPQVGDNFEERVCRINETLLRRPRHQEFQKPLSHILWKIGSVFRQILLNTTKHRISPDMLLSATTRQVPPNTRRPLHFQANYAVCSLIEMSCPNNHGRWIGTEKNTTQTQTRSTQGEHDSGRKWIWNLGQNKVHLNQHTEWLETIRLDSTTRNAPSWHSFTFTLCVCARARVCVCVCVCCMPKATTLLLTFPEAGGEVNHVYAITRDTEEQCRTHRVFLNCNYMARLINTNCTPFFLLSYLLHGGHPFFRN